MSSPAMARVFALLDEQFGDRETCDKFQDDISGRRRLFEEALCALEKEHADLVSATVSVVGAHEARWLQAVREANNLRRLFDALVAAYDERERELRREQRNPHIGSYVFHENHEELARENEAMRDDIRSVVEALDSFKHDGLFRALKELRKHLPDSQSESGKLSK